MTRRLNKPIHELLAFSWLARLKMLTLAALMISALALNSCGGVIVGGAATGGVAAVQERSIGDAVDDLTIRAQLNQLFFEDNIDLHHKHNLN